MSIIKKIMNTLVDLIISIIDIAKKTGAVCMVLGYIILLLWSIIKTLTGWYFTGIQESVKGFLVLCICIGLLLHIGEKIGEENDNIGGDSNEEDDTELREDL